MEAAEESVEYQRELWRPFVKKSMEEMTAAGLKVYRPDKAPFRKRGKELWKEFDSTVIAELADLDTPGSHLLARLEFDCTQNVWI